MEDALPFRWQTLHRDELLHLIEDVFHNKQTPWCISVEKLIQAMFRKDVFSRKSSITALLFLFLPFHCLIYNSLFPCVSSGILPCSYPLELATEGQGFPVQTFGIFTGFLRVMRSPCLNGRSLLCMENPCWDSKTGKNCTYCTLLLS